MALHAPRRNTPVYAAPVDKGEALYWRNVDVCQTIRNYPAISERMRRSVISRVEACTESHFEYLLHVYSFSAVKQKLNFFRTHVGKDCFLHVLVCAT
jgi:hypothetical protein